MTENNNPGALSPGQEQSMTINTLYHVSAGIAQSVYHVENAFDLPVVVGNAQLVAERTGGGIVVHADTHGITLQSGTDTLYSIRDAVNALISADVRVQALQGVTEAHVDLQDYIEEIVTQYAAHRAKQDRIAEIRAGWHEQLARADGYAYPAYKNRMYDSGNFELSPEILGENCTSRSGSTLAELVAAIDQYVAEYPALHARIVAERAAEAAEKARQQQEADARHAAEIAYRDAWISQRGSAALRLGHEKGYACQKRFKQEWGAAELGADYVLDYNNDVTVKPRSCPSEVALVEQVRIESLGLPATARVVWLPSGLDELDEDYDEDYDEHTPREAVEVHALTSYFYLIVP